MSDETPLWVYAIILAVLSTLLFITNMVTLQAFIVMLVVSFTPLLMVGTFWFSLKCDSILTDHDPLRL